MFSCSFFFTEMEISVWGRKRFDSRRRLTLRKLWKKTQSFRFELNWLVLIIFLSVDAKAIFLLMYCTLTNLCVYVLSFMLILKLETRVCGDDPQHHLSENSCLSIFMNTLCPLHLSLNVIFHEVFRDFCDSSVMLHKRKPGSHVSGFADSPVSFLKRVHF